MSRRRITVIVALILSAGLNPVARAAEIPVTGRAEPGLAGFDELMRRFLRDHDVPGAALAVGRNGRIVYARGFGYADVAKGQPVEPDSLFRIASVSKPFTAAAVMQLRERGKLRLDDHPFKLLGLKPHLEDRKTVDSRLYEITVAELLHHTGGFNRGASFDPMFRSVAIAKAFGTPPPAGSRQITEYMMGRTLDFDPGTGEEYSNFGYCALGRLIEKVSGLSYEQYVEREILRPLGIRRMRIGRSLERDRAPGEVRYYPRNTRLVNSVFAAAPGKVPECYGGWCIEAMDAHGGWIASAPELVRFAASLDDPARCPILKVDAIDEMFRRPSDTGFDADGKPKAAYYACGWMVRPVGNGGKANTWHNGLLAGTSTLLVRRHDGLCWAVLFNADFAKDQPTRDLAGLIDGLIHPVADGVKQWPAGWEFREPESGIAPSNGASR